MAPIRVQKKDNAGSLNEDDSYQKWVKAHVVESQVSPTNYFFETAGEFEAGRAEARGSGGAIFCRLSPWTQNYVAPYSMGKEPAIYLGQVAFGQALSLDDQLKFGSGVKSGEEATAEAAITSPVFAVTSKVVLLTHELEALKESFPFIRQALARLQEQAVLPARKQQDFRISPEVSCSIKTGGGPSGHDGEISVFRLVSNASQTKSLSNSYQQLTLNVEELEYLFKTLYNDLMISLENKFARSRAYGTSGVDVEALMGRVAPKLAAQMAARGKAENKPLCGVADEGREEDLLHRLRLLKAQDIELLCLPELPKLRRGAYSRVYFSFLLTKLLHRQGARLIFDHVFPPLPPFAEEAENEAQLSQYIQDHDL